MRRVPPMQLMKLNMDYSVEAPCTPLQLCPFPSMPSEGSCCPESGVYSYLSLLYISLLLYVSP